MIKVIFKNHFNYAFFGRMVRWHLNYYIWGKGFPLSAGVYITDGCNCQCVMCHIWKTKRPNIYPRESQEKAIDALSRMGCFYYSVSGGEPTLVKDLPERLAYAAQKIPYVRLVTNGLTMDKDLASALGKSGIKEISISLDGTEDFHNFLRGRPDAYERSWNAINLIYAHAPGLKVVVNTILTPYNLDTIKELNNRLDVFSGISQKLLPLTFHGLFRTERLKSLPASPTKASLREMKKFLVEMSMNTKIVNSQVFLKKALLFFKGEYNIIREQKRCLYSYHAIEFDVNGAAYPCATAANFENGILVNGDFEEYLKSSRYQNWQRKLEGCDKCNGSMMLCYYEPRLNFPIHNLITGYFQGFAKLN